MHLSPSNSVWNSLTWPEMLNQDREWGLQPGNLTCVGRQRNYICGHSEGCVHPSAVLSRWWNTRSGTSTPEHRQSQHTAKELCGALSDISPRPPFFFFLIKSVNLSSQRFESLFQQTQTYAVLTENKKPCWRQIGEIRSHAGGISGHLGEEKQRADLFAHLKFCSHQAGESNWFCCDHITTFPEAE